MSCDSLTFGGNAFQSLLAKNVKDRCINSRLKGGRSSLVLSPRKLYCTTIVGFHMTSLKCEIQNYQSYRDFFQIIQEQLKNNIHTNVKSITFMFMSSSKDKFMLLWQNSVRDVSVVFRWPCWYPSGWAPAWRPYKPLLVTFLQISRIRSIPLA